jgi:hypothetical protein
MPFTPSDSSMTTQPVPSSESPLVPATDVIWCVFESMGHSYVIDLDAVVEVRIVERLLRLPDPPGYVIGLIMLRRDLIPVLTPDSEPDSPPPQVEPGASVLVLRSEDHFWGVVVKEGSVRVVKDQHMWIPSEESWPDDPTAARVPGFDGWIVINGHPHRRLDPAKARLKLRAAIKEDYSRSSAVSRETVSDEQ